MLSSSYFKAANDAISYTIEEAISPPKKRLKASESTNCLAQSVSPKGKSLLKHTSNNRKNTSSSKMPSFLFMVSSVKSNDTSVELKLKRVESQCEFNKEFVCIMLDSW